MIAVLLLLAALAPVDLIDQNVEIPAGDWRYVPRAVTQEPAQVDCVFQSDRPDAQVRVVLLSHADLDAWRVGRDHEEIATTTVGPRGVLRIPLHDVDSYLAIENRGTRPVRVHLRVFLEHANVRYLSRQRQLAVIVISFGVFFAIVTLSARRLLRGIKLSRNF